MKDVSLDLFSQYIGEGFVIEPDDATTTTLELIEVKGLMQAAPAPPASAKKNQPFSLIFSGPQDIFLKQKTYAIHHKKMGSIDLFLVPIAQDDAGYRYEAIFN